MANFSSSTVVFFSSVIFLLLSPSSANVVCEDLPADLCSFGVSFQAKRCVLERIQREKGQIEHKCRTSEVLVDQITDWIETEECIKNCGVDRNMVGISSDSLLEPQFASMLCSPQCYHNCPNIVDLYFNLAAGEGVFLPNLCEANKVGPHRSMGELLSSGGATSAPAPSKASITPAMAPSKTAAAAMPPSP
ncbi:hypothetical protein ZOSMA_162G00220 [Zostera marina]|uniref:PAR1 protein n=1 Tax=Zostera marina TaxID=29655 RepID=A0A0K9PW67_ZOSMR|nr:hypothetical protein ZOSMA_162G00220 [Zostera marina]